MSISNSTESADRAPGPVSASERYDALDTLRGVAVLGILVMNIYAFAMPLAAYMNPLMGGGQEWYNLATWFTTHILADQKFMAIFSMLFGAGIVLMWQRAAAREVSFAGIYYRRMSWLLLIGLLHGYLLWFGDILFYYALIGMLIYPARKWRPRTLIIVACLMLPVTLLMNQGGFLYMSALQEEVAGIEALEARGEALDEEQQAKLDEWAGIASFIAPTPEILAEDIAVHRGSYADILAWRIPFVSSMQISNTIMFMLWRAGGLMLLGMALMKLGVLSGERDAAFYRKLMLYGYGLGLPLLVFSSYLLNAQDFDGLYFMRVGAIPNYIGSILIALGHVGLVMRIVQCGLFRQLAERFAAVGRMAFTNYLLHSLVMTTIFYGYGFGLYGEVPRAAQMLFVAGMIGLQLWLSPWWLARFRFGPAEWLWRSLTYWQRQPMRAATGG